MWKDKVVKQAQTLYAEARTVNERRIIVLAGDREAGYALAEQIIDGCGMPWEDTTAVSSYAGFPCETVNRQETSALLGQTNTGVIYDLHTAFSPNGIGRATGSIDGGGLGIFLIPDFDLWSKTRSEIDQYLAVPPFDINDVTGHFREHLMKTLQRHRGICIISLEHQSVVKDGQTHPAPRCVTENDKKRPAGTTFPDQAYQYCQTNDQRKALQAIENLTTAPTAISLESNRGRGKSAVAGIGAACLATMGYNIVVTAPAYQNAQPVFKHGSKLLETLGVETCSNEETKITTPSGGIRFCKPAEIPDQCADILVVDEAAALPVNILECALSFDRVVFATTVHGYEGTGRGFSLRFKETLTDSDHTVHEVHLEKPIRYAEADPIEVWMFEALQLNAKPAVEQRVSDIPLDVPEYRSISSGALMKDRQLRHEIFGILVYAHYQTEPNDIHRILDSPNTAIRAIVDDQTVLAVAVVAREGDLSEDQRRRMYEGEQVGGNMIPDVLTGQLRDEQAGNLIGARVLRIATHPVIQSKGFGTRLLSELKSEVETGIREWPGTVDWLGVAFGATTDLLRFWQKNGYQTVHFGTKKNEKSGKYSVIMLQPLTEAGRELFDRTSRRLSSRIRHVIADALSEADAEIILAVLSSVEYETLKVPSMTEWEWNVVISVAYGPGNMDVAPRPFSILTLRYFADPSADTNELTTQQQQLLVMRALQYRSWEETAAKLGYHSASECRRAIGDACKPLIKQYSQEKIDQLAGRFDNN